LDKPWRTAGYLAWNETFDDELTIAISRIRSVCDIDKYELDIVHRISSGTPSISVMITERDSTWIDK
jgi:hypothetical protein